jgi:hypothetical protein
MNINPAVYESCEVTLDSAEDDERLNKLIPKSFVISFRRCLITYSGGPINIKLTFNQYNVPLYQYTLPKTTPPAKSMVNVNVDHTLEFQNCVFIFKLKSLPPPLGSQLTRFLLANTGPIIKLQSPTHS